MTHFSKQLYVQRLMAERCSDREAVPAASSTGVSFHVLSFFGSARAALVYREFVNTC